MAEFPAMPLWTDALEVRAMLIRDGWRSPDTYCTFYGSIEDRPAVYLFLLYQNHDYKNALFAYVGMSTRLAQRLCGHEILREINGPGYWPMRWFKPTPPDKLRSVERRYIERFNPAWNIVGRRRGVVLQ